MKDKKIFQSNLVVNHEIGTLIAKLFVKIVLISVFEITIILNNKGGGSGGYGNMKRSLKLINIEDS